jgi:hypothetical protein
MGCVTHVQCIEAAESLPAALTGINLGFCRVQSLMSPGDFRKNYPARVGEREKASPSHVLAIVLSSEALIAPRPLALVRTFLRVRPQVT